MSRASSPHDSPCPLFRLSAELTRAQTVDAAVAHAIELAEAALDHPIVSVHEHDPTDGTTSTVDASAAWSNLVADDPAWPPASAVNALGDRPSNAATTPQATLAADPRDPFRAELLIPVGRAHLLAVGTTDRDGFDDAAVTVAEGLAATLETALARIDRRRSPAVDNLVGASFDQSDEAAFVSAPDGTLVAVNRAALELTGREREELLGGDLSVLCRAGATEAVCEHLDRAATGASEPCRATVCRADGEERSVEFASRPVEANGSTYVHTTARGLSTTSGDRSARGGDRAETDATALRRLNELTVDPGGFDETVERVLSLGRDYLGLDTAILSRVEGDDYEIEAVVDATETHETGAVYDITDTMCAATLAGSTTEILAFSDVADSAHRDHPAAEAVRSYIAAPVVVDGDTHGTVNFSMATPREEAFRPEERAFITLVAQWIGTEIERRRRVEELERYETILEAVDDPVYALDTDGRFTFVNAAAQAEFGYGPEIIGEHPSIGMADSDVGRIREQIEDLIATDKRSTTVEFDLETADGRRRIVENKLALIGDDEFRGTAGVVRDVTDRDRRRRQLESFQEAIDEAADGVAILDDGEFVYVDRTHTAVYGFEEKGQLLGESWQVLYDDAEIERLKTEAFPALEADGHWRGRVTGRRQDGSTFPSEISLTVIDDGRLVCVVRDETERQRRERELASFQRAIESARDGVAILDDGEYTYVDETHVEMYGFEEKAQLLGDSWRRLYDDAEIERLEAEAFPALETDGYWRGRVTGSRPDGSTFPAELSLTIVDGGRLVCTVRDETERRARERELELKERAMDEANVGIQITDPTRETNPLVYVNDGFERITGYDREEALGRNPRFLQGEDTDAEQRTRLRDAIDAETPVSLELRNRRKDGTPYWSRLSVTPVTDETGITRNYIGIQQDITERKRRERRKNATVDVLERVYAVTTDPDLSFDEKLDGLLAAGTEYLDLPYGFVTRIEPGGEDAPGTQTIVEAHGDHDRLQSGASCLLPESYCRKTIENDGPLTVTSAGEDGWEGDPAYERFELEAYMGGVIDVDGDTYGTLCFASSTQRERPFDETERSFLNLLRRWVGYEVGRRKARDDMREQRERLELALSGTNTGIAEWNLRTDEVAWNETLVDLIGRNVTSPEEFEAAVHPADRERVRERLEESIRTGEPWAGEFRMIDAAGDVLWIGSRAAPTYDEDGEPVRLLATGTDISERKREEAERRQNERRYRTLAENIPNGAVLTFDDDLRYDLAAGELLSEFGFEQSDVIGREVGTLLPDADDISELVTRFRAAIDGERTERRVELRGRTLRLHLVPIDGEDERSTAQRGLLLVQDVTDEARRERELFEERERLRLLTESVDEYAFFVVGADGDIQTWNESVESTFGYDAETALDTPMSRLYPAADRDRGLPERLLQQARVAGESAHEGWLVCADGSEFYADVQYASLTDDDGAFRGYAAVVRDMTERRRQRRRTERFLEESIDVVTVVDPDGEITYASGSADRVLGHEPDELTGANLFDRFHPDSREEVMEAFFDSRERTNVDSRIEGRFESGDGEWLNVQGQCRNMLDDDAIDGMLVYLRDVTDDTKRARRFESIFNQTYQFTGLLRPDGTVVEINDAALEFGGIERDDTVGEQFGDLPWWTHSEAVGDELRDALDRAASGEFVRYETTVRGADGLATIDFSAKPVTDEDDDVSLLVVEGRDITAQEQHRRHLEVMQRVVRHNMRNDLTKLRGWAGLMCDEDDAETRGEQFARVEGVLDKWEAMSEKMKQIRTLLGSETRLRATADPESILDDAVAPVRDEGADVTVAADAPDAASVRVPPALRDAVRELVENASDATEHGTVEVELARPDDDWVEITVSDDGPGLPEMEADVLATGEETPLNHGQGLGLWMVRMIVTQAGGDVSVDSAADGTTVCLRLPTDRSDETSTPGPTV